MTRIGILGLGEAGSMFAEELAASVEVIGYDPLWTGPGRGFTAAAGAADAVAGADAVLAFTAGHDAEAALESVADVLHEGAVYADFSSSSPALKRRLAERATRARFADAVLLAPVLRARLATEVQASGPGAQRLAELLGPAGMRIEPVGDRPGEAAARKLLRSIVVKGLTALLVESLRAAEDQDLTEWFSTHIADTLTDITPDLLVRLLDGTLTHSVRRVHEMEAAVEMIEAAGGRADMTRATVAVLGTAAEGIPRGRALTEGH